MLLLLVLPVFPGALLAEEGGETRVRLVEMRGPVTPVTGLPYWSTNGTRNNGLDWSFV